MAYGYIHVYLHIESGSEIQLQVVTQVVTQDIRYKIPQRLLIFHQKYKKKAANSKIYEAGTSDFVCVYALPLHLRQPQFAYSSAGIKTTATKQRNRPFWLDFPSTCNV